MGLTSATLSAAARPLHSIVFGALAERIHMYCVVFHTQSLTTMAGAVEGCGARPVVEAWWARPVAEGCGVWHVIESCGGQPVTEGCEVWPVAEGCWV